MNICHQQYCMFRKHFDMIYLHLYDNPKHERKYRMQQYIIPMNELLFLTLLYCHPMHATFDLQKSWIVLPHGSNIQKQQYFGPMSVLQLPQLLLQHPMNASKLRLLQLRYPMRETYFLLLNYDAPMHTSNSRSHYFQNQLPTHIVQ